jgi:hypothetical protein
MDTRKEFRSGDGFAAELIWWHTLGSWKVITAVIGQQLSLVALRFEMHVVGD